ITASSCAPSTPQRARSTSAPGATSGPSRSGWRMSSSPGMPPLPAERRHRDERRARRARMTKGRAAARPPCLPLARLDDQLGVERVAVEDLLHPPARLFRDPRIKLVLGLAALPLLLAAGDDGRRGA